MRLFATGATNSALNLAYARLERAVGARDTAPDNKTRARKTRLVQMISEEIKDLHDQLMWAVIEHDTNIGGLG